MPAMNLAAVEIKAFVPATDSGVSMQSCRNFALSAPGGVAWRIAQNLPRP
jgi:hypothetical protein